MSPHRPNTLPDHMRRVCGKCRRPLLIPPAMCTCRRVHKSLLGKCFFIRHLKDKSFIVQLAMQFKSSVMAPGEMAVLRSMYVIEQGTVLYRAQILTSGKLWGDQDILLTDGHLKYERRDRARAMSYVEYRQLKRTDFISTLECHPAVQREMRVKSVYVALKRFLLDLALADKIKRDPLWQEGLAVPGHKGILDRLNDAVESDWSRQRDEVLAAERMADAVLAKPTPGAQEKPETVGNAEVLDRLTSLAASVEIIAASMQKMSSRQDELAEAVRSKSAAE